MSDKQVVFQQALALTLDERAELIEELVRSFEQSDRASIKDAMAAELADRIHAYKSGEMDSISLEEWIEQSQHL